MTIEELKRYDVILLVDMSGSMTTKDVAVEGSTEKKRRWDVIREQAGAWAREMEEVDSDGPTIGFFNDGFKLHKNVAADKVETIFKEYTPGSGTETHKPLEAVFNDYFANRDKGGKPILVYVITDGETDKEKLARVIVAATKKMNADEEIGVQFIQIGHDADATALLTFLDDNLVSKYGAKFDIVDTTHYDDAVKMPFLALCEKTLND